MYAGIGLWTALSSVSAHFQGLTLSNTIYLIDQDLTNILRCNFNKGTAGFVPIFWRLFPFRFIPLVVLRWESSEILGQVNPYFYQHLPDNLSGEEEPTPSMENNLCPPLCLKVKAELKDKKKTQCQLFIRQAGPIFRHSL